MLADEAHFIGDDNDPHPGPKQDTAIGRRRGSCSGRTSLGWLIEMKTAASRSMEYEPATGYCCVMRLTP